MTLLNNKSDNHIFIIGTGHHARMICENLIENGYKISGFIGKNFNEVGKKIYNEIKVETFDKEFLEKFNSKNNFVINGVGYRSIKSRIEIYEIYSFNGFKFKNFIHSHCQIDRSVEIQDSVIILSGVIIKSFSKIGKNVLINTSSSIDHDNIIGNNCIISPRVTSCGNVKIQDKTFIGAGVNIINNITIGTNCFIGSGVNIQRDIPNNKKVLLKNANLTLDYDI